jgi:hypothetical protein
VHLRFILAALLLVGACQRGPEKAAYAPSTEANFVRACEAQGTAQAVCACTWQKISASVASEEFAAFERLPASARANHALQARITRFAQDCQRYPATP